MQVEITITVNVPEDGVTPAIKINNENIRVKPEKNKMPKVKVPRTKILEKKEEPVVAGALKSTLTRPHRRVTLSTDKILKPEKNLFNGPKARPERKCLYCGEPFVPRAYNQKFDSKSHKDKYNYDQMAKRRKEAKQPPISPRQKKVTIPKTILSQDPFYREQLKKTAQNDKNYDKYVTKS